LFKEAFKKWQLFKLFVKINVCCVMFDLTIHYVGASIMGTVIPFNVYRRKTLLRNIDELLLNIDIKGSDFVVLILARLVSCEDINYSFDLVKKVQNSLSKGERNDHRKND
jgi:hypothetical protein